MRYRNFLLPAVLASALGCSFLLQVDADQCDKDGDCVALGMVGRRCQAGQCVKVAELPDTGEPQEAEPLDTAPPPCTPEQCAALPTASICSPKTLKCEPLVSQDCPFVLGQIGSREAARDPHAVVIAALVPDANKAAAEVQILDLALSEINGGATAGLPPPAPVEGGAGTRRPVAVLVCDDTSLDQPGASPGLSASNRVFSRLGLQSMVWAVGPVELAQVWNNVADSEGAFIINAGGYNRALEVVRSDRMWHMLPGLEKIVDVYGAALQRMEDKTRTTPEAGVGDAPVRVMTLTSPYSVSLLLQDELGRNVNVKINDAGLLSNGASHQFLDVSGDPDASAASIVSFAPHIVISTVGGELIDPLRIAQQRLQAQGGISDGGGLLPERMPRYLFSPFNADALHLQELFENANGYAPAFLARHMAGVNAAGTTTNVNVKLGFQTRFNARFGDAGAAGATESENVYDAIYFAAYATVAASQFSEDERPKGEAIGSGMKRLFSGEPIEVGLAFLAKGFDELVNAKPIALQGTLGPPVFDPTTRAREVGLSVFCVRPKGIPPFEYALDVLRLEVPDGGADGGVDAGANDGGTVSAAQLVGDWAAQCGASNTAL